MQIIINTQAIALAMAKKQLNIAELQEKANVTQGVTRRINAGKPIKPATLGKIAAALDVEPKELI